MLVIPVKTGTQTINIVIPDLIRDPGLSSSVIARVIARGNLDMPILNLFATPSVG